MSATEILTPQPPASAPTPAPPRRALLARLAPSAADLIFLALFLVLSFVPGQQARLLGDANTGWHVRNGQHILATHAVPHADYWTYTRYGQPWVSFEWLFDVIAGALHARAGLGGLVIFCAAVIGGTFALLFRLTLRRSRNAPIAALVSILAAMASGIHFLARPHVMSWLFTVAFYMVLDGAQRQFETEPDGSRRMRPGLRRLASLLPLMLLWVNLHAGFLIGIALLGLYLLANAADWVFSAGGHARRLARRRTGAFALALAGCGAVTFLNPAGWRLHAYVIGYLRQGYFMDHVQEFMSPSFHLRGVKVFEALLLLGILALAFTRRRVRLLDILLAGFGIHSALFAVRNVPLACILLAPMVATWLADCLQDLRQRADLTDWLRSSASAVERFSERMTRMEWRVGGGLSLAALVVAAVLIARGGGPAAQAHFDTKQFPAAAADYLAAQHVHEGVFATDQWGAYLIYRLSPELRVFMDDRHDFFGEQYVSDYLAVVSMEPSWRSVLDRYRVRWVMVAPDSAIAATLHLAPDWEVAYSDSVAVVFKRRG